MLSLNQLPLVKPLLKISHGFSQDNRKLLEEWISRNVPDSAVILEERRVRLKYSSAFQQEMNSPTLISTSYLWKIGQFEDFMSMAVTHVAIKDTELWTAREILAQSARAEKNNDQDLLKIVEKIESEIKASKDQQNNNNVSGFDSGKGSHRYIM